MAKLPYGFDPKQPYLHDDGLHECSTEAEAWARLDDVQTYLSKCQPLPPELAHWLGEAIRHSNGDRTELMQRMGLMRRAGERNRYSRRFKEHWQGRLWHLGTYNETGRSIDQIVKAIQDEMTTEEVAEVPSRETLQDWYTEAMTGSARVR